MLLKINFKEKKCEYYQIKWFSTENDPDYIFECITVDGFYYHLEKTDEGVILDRQITKEWIVRNAMPNKYYIHNGDPVDMKDYEKQFYEGCIHDTEDILSSEFPIISIQIYTDNNNLLYEYSDKPISRLKDTKTKCYIISDGKLCKIGKAINPSERLKDLQTGNSILQLQELFEGFRYLQKFASNNRDAPCSN